MSSEISLIQEFFDSIFYRDMNEELAELSEYELLLHYYHIGWKEGRWPNSWFEQEEYIENHPCIQQYNINPLFHYAICKKCMLSHQLKIQNIP